MKKFFGIFTVMVLILLSSMNVLAIDEKNLAQGINVEPGELRTGDIVAFGKDVSVEGTVTGNVVAFRGNIEIKGTVHGDVIAYGGDIKVSGKIIGNVVTFGGKIIEYPTGEILGERVQGGGLNFGNLFRYNFSIKWSLITLITGIVLSLLIMLIMPNRIENMVKFLGEKPGKVMLAGLLAILSFPVLLAISIVTIFVVIGILLTPSLVLAYIVFGYIGNVALGLFIGKNLSKLLNGEGLPKILQLLLGILLLWGARNLPFVGLLVSFILLFVTLGVVLASKFGKAPVEIPTSPPTSME
ncbi:hypothetical protein [Anaerobranca gottschalkii]|uniref:Polymer-forming cytoskeletal protein n=1 Tax=Anaerobranca gottschalkii DSM 13577 TaxID=1120990 RepID=A0A1I0AVI5_9FIRM|nr:hypothetical protein [Anaerobranca gottschalkii]SES98212.1 hypothetical protein SAMN03080614_102713 [Anaerobranca gottschalkii DSM 13577]